MPNVRLTHNFSSYHQIIHLYLIGYLISRLIQSIQ
nr:MAG TPA: hypothetical protein [Caudoviricetes sp.]